MKAILADVLIAICLPLVAGYLFVILGGMLMATEGRSPCSSKNTSRKRPLDAAIGKKAGRPSPLSADEANPLAGAQVYRQAQCWFAGAARSVRVCHC
jgi:hypothetical protein